MKLLLGTHTWLWFVLGDNALSSSARAFIEDPNNAKLVSPASNWETAIKVNLGKYTLPQPFGTFVERAIQGQGFSVLPILPEHASALSALPSHHRDLSDRLLIAQALTESISIVGCDTLFDHYGVERLW